MNPLKPIYIALGFIFFGLGAVGAFVPVLPTVPFLLLASFCFTKGSTRFQRWFEGTKLYKVHLNSYLQHRSMTLATKIKLQALATVMMGISAIVVPILAVKIFLVVMMLFMFYYFAFRIKTVSKEEIAEFKAKNQATKAQEEDLPPVTIHDTVVEIKEMHEDIFEEAALTELEESALTSES